jgi:hypothetical protein
MGCAAVRGWAGGVRRVKGPPVWRARGRLRRSRQLGGRPATSRTRVLVSARQRRPLQPVRFPLLGLLRARTACKAHDVCRASPALRKSALLRGGGPRQGHGRPDTPAPRCTASAVSWRPRAWSWRCRPGRWSSRDELSWAHDSLRTAATTVKGPGESVLELQALGVRRHGLVLGLYDLTAHLPASNASGCSSWLVAVGQQP